MLIRKIKKSAPIATHGSGKRITIEIETCKSSSICNIQKDLEVGFDEVVFIFLMKYIKDKILLKLIE